MAIYCIGKAEDEARRRIVYFNYNSTGDHGIYCYDKPANTTYIVLTDWQVDGAGLNFNKDKLIQAEIVGDILYWTDNFNEPRRINIEAGIKLNQTNYITSVAPYPTVSSESSITLVRQPPMIPLAWAKVTNGAYVNNFIKSESFQFAWRYTYRDNEISVLSPYSRLVNMNTDSETFNEILITFPITEIIGGDVKKIELIVIYPRNNKAFIIHTFDTVTNAAAVALHNSGTALTYTFRNDKYGIALDNASLVKYADSIPLMCETMEVAKNRLFLGNYVMGYNTPTTSSLTAAFTLTPVVPAQLNSAHHFKNGGAYNVGIVFYDKAGRKSGVYSAATLSSPPRTYTLGLIQGVAEWTLSNTNALTEIPSWAYYYSIVITKNLKTANFIQGFTGSAVNAYVKKTAAGLYDFTSTTTFPTDAVGIAINASELLTTRGIGYTLQPGDVAQIITSTNVNHTLNVLDVSGNYIIVAPKDIGNLSTLGSLFYEIYTPAFGNDAVFYETGKVYKVTNATTSSRQYSVLVDSIVGDVFNIGSPANEAMNPTDKEWKQWFTNTGRPNIITDAGQTHLPGDFCFSNVFIQGTKVNGLSTFDPLDTASLSIEYGALRKLELTAKVQSEGTVMLAICENETASVYLGEAQLSTSTGESFIAKAEGVIGTINTLKGNYGTTNPESVTQHRGNVYWFDAPSGEFVIYSINGIDSISKNKAKRFSKLFAAKYKSVTSAAIEAFGSRPFVFGVVDPYHKEVLWSIPKVEENPKGNLSDYSSPTIPYPYDLYDGGGWTLVYKLEADRFMGKFTFRPEMFANLGEELYSFQNGLLYKNNSTASYNTFFGTVNESKIMFISNANPVYPKTYLGFTVESDKKPSFVHFRSEYPNVQSSDLDASDFTTKEGVHYSPILRDRLSPNKTGDYNLKQLKGDKMIATGLKCMVRFTAPVKLKFIDLKYRISSGHTDI